VYACVSARAWNQIYIRMHVNVCVCVCVCVCKKNLIRLTDTHKYYGHCMCMFLLLGFKTESSVYDE
jgi:hypothetical protein